MPEFDREARAGAANVGDHPEEWDGTMERLYRRYCGIAALMFVFVTVYTVPVKLLQGRLDNDWLHSVLHLGSGVAGAYCWWYAPDVRPARAFTWSVGVGYFALAVYGAFTPGLLADTPFAIPLGIAENTFHLALSLPALAILALDIIHGAPVDEAANEG